MLCDLTETTVNVVVYNFIADLLLNGVTDKQTLCVIDAAVVRSQDHCVSPGISGGVEPMAELMRLLALKWERQGELERADQLYRSAYALLEKSSVMSLPKQGVLYYWALLKVKRGETERAVELIRLHTAVARQDYEAGKFPVASLISALWWEAALLEKLGLASEAQAARDEAEKLESK